jgi:hypothetical protein
MPIEPVIPLSDTEKPVRPAHRWYHILPALLLIVFCIELGTFLIVFPWTGLWDSNLFSSIRPEWHGWREVWNNAYVRGAISGLGVINLYIALGEIFRLRRFSR